MTNTPHRPRLLRFSPASETPSRATGDDRFIAGADSDDHDDFGGLHRDLRATGAAMDRRDLFRMAARLGAGVGALPILGCSGDTQTTPSSSSSTGGSTSNLSQVSLASDSVFRDGSALELATMTGNVASGFTATLTVAV